MNLENRYEMRELMEKFHISAQKKYGQNFLTDTSVLDGIIEAAGITDENVVLEIGPGLGTLTRRLSEAAGKVIAVEIDNALIPVLKETLADYPNVSVINGDIMKTDIGELIKENLGDNLEGKIKVVANLPYYITTPIVLKLIEYSEYIDSITIMIQKEVAVRMQAKPGNKDYGALSLAVQYYSNPQIMVEAPADCFFPMPGVDSVVIKLDMFDKPPVDVNDPDFMFKLIRATFNMRRKTLTNGISSGGLGISRAQVEDALEQMELSKTIRGEVLSLEQFAALANILLVH